jgi:hypothetical protein
MTDTTTRTATQPATDPSRTHRPAGRPRRTLVAESSLAVAETAYRLLTSGPAALSFDGRGYPGLPGRELALPQLRPRLLARSCPRSTRDAVWAELVRRSRTQGAAWTVACVGMALPALMRLAGELCSTLADGKADVHAEILRGFLTGLTTVDLDRPSIVSRLRWHAYRAGRATVRDVLDAPTPVGSGFDSTPPPPLAGHPDFVLARAVADNAISQPEAEVIGTTRLEDVSLREWALKHQLNYVAARQVRSRAERRLLAWLTDQEPGVGTADVGPEPKHATETATKDGAPELPHDRRDHTYEQAAGPQHETVSRGRLSHIGPELGIGGRRRTPATPPTACRPTRRPKEPRCA